MSECLVIAVDGLDGSGKTTVVDYIKKYFIKQGVLADEIVVIKALGYGAIGDRLRSEVLFSPDFKDEHEALYVGLALVELFHYRLKALKENHKVIIIDRYITSYYAYQLGLNKPLAREIYNKFLNEHLVKDIIKPDVFIYLSVDVKTSIKRIEERDTLIQAKDRFDSKEIYEKMAISNYFDHCFEESLVPIKWKVDANRTIKGVKLSLNNQLKNLTL